MIDGNIETNSDRDTSDGIWANFMNWLSDRTGLGIQWLQFIGLLIGALAAFLVSEWLHQTTWDSAALLFRIGTVVSAVGAVIVLLPSVGRRI